MFRFKMMVDNLLRNTNIHNRLIFSFIFLSLLPLSMTGFLSYSKSSQAMDEKTETYLIQMLNEVSKNIRNRMDKVEAASDEAYLSRIVQENIPLYNQPTDQDTVKMKYELNEFLGQKFSIVQGVQLAQMIDYSGNAYVGVLTPEIIKSKYQQRLIEHFPDIERLSRQFGGAAIWTMPPFQDEEGHVLLARSINSLINDSPLATLMIAVDNAYFSATFADLDLGKGSSVFIVNSSGIVISSRRTDFPAGLPFRESELVAELARSRAADRKAFPITIDQGRHLAVYAPIGKTDWSLVSVLPYSELNADSRKIGFYILLITAVCFIFSLYLSSVISRSISIPLKKLVKAMNATRDGDFALSISDGHRDELAVVAGNFDRMVKEIRNLLHNIKSKEDQKRIAELKALQAQINPHFLSNTLNAVRYLAQVQKADNIDNLVTSLIQLLHLSMGKGDDLITMREEIEYLKNYVNIQHYRYYDVFDVHFEVEEAALDCKILKFLLQPLVENSIIHGLEPKNGQGLIVVKGYREVGHLHITVTDDGVGMSKERNAELLTADPVDSGRADALRSAKYGRVGLKNVDNRIKLYFGEQYGLRITSVPNLYTTVEVTIPIQ